MAYGLGFTNLVQPSLGTTQFPPAINQLPGGDHTALAHFGANFLNAVLPTERAQQVVSVFDQTPTTPPGQQTGVGNDFVASYAPQIYAVFLNGLVANTAIPVAASRATPDLARPPISGDPTPELPGLPPVPTVPPLEGTDPVIAALQPLAGSGAIFSSVPTAVPASAPTPAPVPVPQTATASSGAARKAA